MESITKIYDRHKGYPIAVLGGGESLPEDVKNLPEDCILIAANHHAYYLKLRTDYLVFKDDPRKRPHLIEAFKWHTGEVISKLLKYSDYQIDVKHYDRGFTGMLCCWLACVMTDQEVILCGMDCYSTEKKYFHNQPFNRNAPVDNYLRQWQLAWGEVPHVTGCPNPERISATGGPLTNIFKQYEHNKGTGV